MGSIIVDSCLVTYVLEHHPRHGERVRQAFAQENPEGLAMPEEVYLQAAQLRARFGLKSPDALHLATAITHDCRALWTADGRLQRAAGALAVNVLAN
ncbi:PIN domain-containing protein [Thiomonas sp. FB-6]|uniref:type II toxin-antitoxin system VapC family toxin n=1 Tax=Thiomonas sp. FB-6 TaxID=1158291 RepID=UPI000369CA23|nr:PIN domain-containing protein [Thiomonas sp. FB-6]